MYNYILKKELNTLISNELIESVKAFYENLHENSKTIKFQIYIYNVNLLRMEKIVWFGGMYHLMNLL